MWSKDSVYKSRAYVHVFEQDGISVQDLVESRNIVNYISDAYKDWVDWRDWTLRLDEIAVVYGGSALRVWWILATGETLW